MTETGLRRSISLFPAPEELPHRQSLFNGGLHPPYGLSAGGCPPSGGPNGNRPRPTTEDYLRMYRQWCQIRTFEDNAKQLITSRPRCLGG